MHATFEVRSRSPWVVHLEWQWLSLLPETHYATGGNHQLYPTSHIPFRWTIYWKAWVQVLYSHSFITAGFEGLVIHQSIPSPPVNRSSKLWSCRKVTQVEDQIIFGQPHGITLLRRWYSTVGRNKLVQISLKLDLMGHRHRSLSHGTSHCCGCFKTYAEVCIFIKLALLPLSSSPLCIAADFHSSY